MAGTAGKSFAGSSLVISLILASIVDGGVCFAFAEYSSRYNVIGSNYIYTYIVSGEILAYLIGFSEFVCATISPSISAIAIVAYFQTFLESVGVHTDNNIIFGYSFSVLGINLSMNLGAIIVIIILGIITINNVKCGSTIINYGATFNVILILVCTFGGIPYVSTDNWFHPCDPQVEQEYNAECPSDAHNSWMPYGINGLIAASGLCIWSIDGSWYCVTVAEEAKNAKRDIPRAIIICLIIVALLFIGLTVTVMGMVPFYALNEDSCVADAFKQNGSIWLQRISSFGASSNMIVSALGYTVAAPRQAWRFSKDGFLCKCFSYLSPKTQIPSIGTFIFMIIGILCAGFIDLTNILAFGIVSMSIWYCTTTSGIIILRYCPPELHGYIEAKKRKDKFDEQPENPALINSDISSSGSYEYPTIIDGELYITETWTESRIFRVVWNYFVSSMIISYLLVNRHYFIDIHALLIIWWVLVTILAISILCSVCCIIYFHFKFDWKSWIDQLNSEKPVLMPFVPFFPLLVVFSLSYMIATFGLILMIEAMAVFLIGFIYYFCYGYRKSVLWERHLTKAN